MAYVASGLRCGLRPLRGPPAAAIHGRGLRAASMPPFGRVSAAIRGRLIRHLSPGAALARFALNWAWLLGLRPSRPAETPGAKPKPLNMNPPR